MPIRVLHIISSLRLGGAQVVLKHIVENASDACEHHVYPLRSRQIDIPIQGNIIKLAYPNYDPRKFFAIFSLCKKYNIDIIHAHLHKPILGALLSSYFQNIPVIVHEHGPICRRGVQYSMYRLMLRFLNKKAFRYIAVSNAVKTQLTTHAAIDPGRIDTVYNAVDLEKFVPQPTLRDSIRKELGISPDTLVIGFVGRLSPVKGPDILLEAFEILTKKRDNFKLIFLGTGAMKDQLTAMTQQAGLSKHVHFLGFRENISEIMNAFDIGCMPSRQEPFGIVALEMMSMGIPLIASGADGLSELVKDHQNALVLKDLTAAEIAENILELADNPHLQKQLQAKAADFCQTFSTQTLVNTIETIYRSAITSTTASQHDL